MKIVVLGGGISDERSISLQSAYSVCRALRQNGHKAIFVDLFFGLKAPSDGLESLFEDETGLVPLEEPSLELIQRDKLFQMRDEEQEKVPGANAEGKQGEMPGANEEGNQGEVSGQNAEGKQGEVPGSDAEGNQGKVPGPSVERNQGKVLGPNVAEICLLADVVFNCLHGEYGEDGRVQGFLDLIGVKYTGSGCGPCSLAINKAITRKLLAESGLPVAPLTDRPPCVLKITNGGSSIGTFICDTEADLENAKKSILEYQCQYFCEEKITGREFTVSVLGDKALEPVEIITPEGYSLDYDTKYKKARLYCPADLTASERKTAMDIAERAHKALGLSAFSRTDIMLDNTGRFYVLEVNAIPGLTSHSALPMSAKAGGMDFRQLCETILTYAMEDRHL